ncbi:hypothetical protein ATCC90586_008314 [Pythium insidiosum]|nr:hypothetical protein ATCC90586_008314 [Pythium insidiosum]
MTKRAFAGRLLLLLGLQLSLCSATFRVVVPTVGEGAPNGSIAHRVAHFGRPPYGRGLVAALVPAPASDPRGCEPFTDAAVHKALQQAGVESDRAEDAAAEPFVLLVERGGCHFVAKARHAQAAGAVGLVVVDTDAAAKALPIMADDGTAGDVHIPSVIIGYTDGQQLATLVSRGRKTIVELQWDVPVRAARHVDVAMWLSSRMPPPVARFVRQFRVVLQALGPSVTLTPFYDVYDGHAWGCSVDHADDRPAHCPQLCILNETVCAYDPDRDNTAGLNGRDVLEEDVRQLCLHRALSSANRSDEFWDYVVHFHERCSPADATAAQFNADCSRVVRQSLQLPSLERCIRLDSAALLATQLSARQTLHLVDIPTLLVNDVPLAASLTCDEPISAATCPPLAMICAAFDASAAPPACAPSFWSERCLPPLERDACGDCTQRNTSTWNQRCAGCDGVPHSGVRVDECGVCGGDGSFDACGRCLPAGAADRDQSCTDCHGVPNGPAHLDACGVCGGHGSFDACGLCLDALDPRRQNIACRVAEDPDAVSAKMNLVGLGLRDFRGSVVRRFQEAVASACGVSSADAILVRSVDEPHAGAVAVLFFVACDGDECRERVTHSLQEPMTAQLIAAKMKDVDDAQQNAVMSEIAHIALHVTSSSSASGSPSAPLEILTKDYAVNALVALVAIAAILVVGVVRVRDDRMRREFQQLVSRYAPLTAMDDDYEYEFDGGARGRASGSTGADAW